VAQSHKRLFRNPLVLGLFVVPGTAALVMMVTAVALTVAVPAVVEHPDAPLAAFVALAVAAALGAAVAVRRLGRPRVDAFALGFGSGVLSVVWYAVIGTIVIFAFALAEWAL